MEIRKRLEVGCGVIQEKLEDTVYLDIKRFPGVDIIRDLEKGLPFDDNKFYEIKAHHVLEHVNDLIFVMNEFHRVLKLNGTLDVEVPYGINSRIDPTHVRFFTPQGFDFFIHKDFNSVNSGVLGWFELLDLQLNGPSKDDIRGLRFIFKKVNK